MEKKPGKRSDKQIEIDEKQNNTKKISEYDQEQDKYSQQKVLSINSNTEFDPPGSKPGEFDRRGKLKIFFGYAAGVGKTYSMLEAGHEAKKKGADVVIGYLEPHARKDTIAQAQGLETLQPLSITYNGLPLREMDLDGILARKPQLALVDELAHTNARGVRHAKRYQDVRELLQNGIDVYTTVNVQHIESLREVVAAITGIQVAERIPDDVFDLADQVELVDIEPKELLERFAEGKVYQQHQADMARQNFFTIDNLSALREIALRRCADRLNRKQPIGKVQDHILVCLSSSPSNAGIIRAAARMAQAFHGRFTALYIQSPQSDALEKEDAARLEENMRLANRLGARIETVFGESIARQIGTYAKVSHATKIVVGRYGRKSAFLHPSSLTDQLSESAPNAEIFIIPDADRIQTKRPVKHFSLKMEEFLRGFFYILAPLAAATMICFGLQQLGISEANLFAIYIFSVLLTAVFSRNMVMTAINSILSVLVFRYYFAWPRHSLDMVDQGYLLSFILVIALSLVIANLASKSHRQQTFMAGAAAKSSLLYETGQNMLQADTDEQIVSQTVSQLHDLTGKDIVFYPNVQEKLGKPVCSEHPEIFENGKEQAVAMWVLKNNKRAGATTDTLSGARCLYLAVRHKTNVHGVVGIDLKEGKLTPDETSMILSILGQSALCLENNQNARISEENALKSQQEHLQIAMLRSISHDLRTPLTTISASADMLLDSQCSPENRKRLTRTIYEDSIWLRDTVENLLALTRLEDGSIALHKELVDMEEVAAEALRHVHPSGGHLEEPDKEHPIRLIEPKEDAFVQADGKLLVQLLVNLIDNALKYTPCQTPIEVEIRSEGSRVVVDVADHGPGISQGEKEHLFEPFITSHNEVVDSKRSLGLGLSLCKSIMDVHGGTIEVLDNNPGARFRIGLDRKVVSLENLEDPQPADPHPSQHLETHK